MMTVYADGSPAGGVGDLTVRVSITNSPSRRPRRPRRLAVVVVGAALLMGTIVAGPNPGGAANATSSGAVRQVPQAPKLLGPVLFLGDSVGASVQWSLPRLLTAGNYSHTFDATSGRCTMRTTNRCSRGDAFDALAKLDASFKPTFAIIELGYNDTKTALALGVDAVMQNLVRRGVTRVLWINMSERRPNGNGGSVYGPSNDVLERAAKRWSELTILDWNSASSGADAAGWFAQYSNGKVDLIHLNTTGQKKFAQWIRDELDRLRVAGVLPGSEGASATTRPNVKRGDNGQYVIDVQTALVARGAQISKDGKFGPATEAAVRAFQKAAGLYVDGLVGKRTWKALGF